MHWSSESWESFWWVQTLTSLNLMFIEAIYVWHEIQAQMFWSWQSWMEMGMIAFIDFNKAENSSCSNYGDQGTKETLFWSVSQFLVCYCMTKWKFWMANWFVSFLHSQCKFKIVMPDIWYEIAWNTQGIRNTCDFYSRDMNDWNTIVTQAGSHA